jgi:hypothetical protein
MGCWFSCWLACCSAALLGCGDSHGPNADSETHFLVRCDADGACKDGLSCVCGACTEVCKQDGDCAELAAPAACRAPLGGGDACAGEQRPAGVCDVTCDEDADCAAVGSDHRCEGGACRAPSASSEPDDKPEPICGLDDALLRGATRRVASPTVLDRRVALVTGTDQGAALIDVEGNVLGLAFEESVPSYIWEQNPGANPVELTPVAVTSAVSDGQTVFWSVAAMEPPSPLPDPQFPIPPSSIQRVRIDGLDHAVLLESDSLVYGSLRVDDDSLYFQDAGQQSLSRMAKDGTSPEVVASGALFHSAQLGEHLYALDSGGDLIRTQLQTGDVETVLAIDDQPALASGEPMLSRMDDLKAVDGLLVIVAADPRAPDGQPDQTIATFDPETGCLRVLAVPDTGIVYPLRPDRGAVYWKGFPHGGFSPGDPVPSARLWRTDVRTGESVHLEPEDLAVTSTVDVLGQDAENLYVTTGDDVIRVVKR